MATMTTVAAAKCIKKIGACANSAVFLYLHADADNKQMNINCIIALRVRLAVCLCVYVYTYICTCVRIVPPRWIVEPSDVSVERNRQIALHCQAQGVPTPVIVWKKTTGERHKRKFYELFILIYTTCIANDTLEIIPPCSSFANWAFQPLTFPCNVPFKSLNFS